MKAIGYGIHKEDGVATQVLKGDSEQTSCRQTTVTSLQTTAHQPLILTAKPDEECLYSTQHEVLLIGTSKLLAPHKQLTDDRSGLGGWEEKAE